MHSQNSIDTQACQETSDSVLGVPVQSRKEKAPTLLDTTGGKTPKGAAFNAPSE